MNSQLFDPQQAQISETMKDRYQFCIWKKEERNGKPTKVPYNPKQPDFPKNYVGTRILIPKEGFNKWLEQQSQAK